MLTSDAQVRHYCGTPDAGLTYLAYFSLIATRRM